MAYNFFGLIKLKQVISQKQYVDFAYGLIKKIILLNIGCDLGKCAYRLVKGLYPEYIYLKDIPFEVTSNPVDLSVDDLVFPKNKLFTRSTHFPESPMLPGVGYDRNATEWIELKQRIGLIEELMKYIFETLNVLEIEVTLYEDYLEAELFTSTPVKCMDFSTILTDLIMNDQDCIVPDVRLIVSR